MQQLGINFMKNVIFDVGRVLINWDVNTLFLDVIGDQDQINAFIEETNFFDWNLQLDCGLSFEEGVKLHSEKFPDYAHIFDAFDKRWVETVPAAIDESVAILNQLKENNTPLYAITNFSAEKWVDACQMYPFLASSFIDTIVSGEVKITKPEAAIYQLLLNRNNLDAKDCIFIDDTQANVDAACTLGIDGILFTSSEQFESDLQTRDIL
jgi:2-haloacid dehalogenase